MGASSLFGQLFVWLHHQFDIPAIDAMVHHYLHPLRDLIIACIVTGSNYIFHLIVKQQRIVVETRRCAPRACVTSTSRSRASSIPTCSSTRSTRSSR